MRRVLFISPLDRERIPNSRDRNIASYFVARGAEVTVMTLAHNTSRDLRALLRDTLTSRHSTSHWHKQTVVRVDPLFNPCSGLHSEEQQRVSSGDRSTTARTRMIHVLAPLGVLRDLPIIPTFLFRALRMGLHFDACIAYGPWAGAVAWLLRKCGRADVILYDDQDYEPGIVANKLRRLWAAWLEVAMMRRADFVVSVGYRLAALRQAQTGRELVVIPNGFAHEVFRSVTKSPRALPTLVYVGNVVGWSGLDLMIESLPLLLQRFPGTRLTIIGSGMAAYEEHLKERTRTLALEQHVVFVGGVNPESLPAYLAEAHIGLAHFRPEPFRRYAFPLKVIEYMACGLPVIGTRHTETADILARYDCGVAVDFTRRSLIAGLTRLLADPALRERYSRNGVRAARHFNWEILAEREYNLVANAIRSNGKGVEHAAI